MSDLQAPIDGLPRGMASSPVGSEQEDHGVSGSDLQLEDLFRILSCMAGMFQDVWRI